MTNKIKQRFKNINKTIMKRSNNVFLRLNKTPKVIKYSSATTLFLIGGFFMTNPLLPGWIFILLGIGLFFPGLQYKYIGKHFKSDKIRKVEDDICSYIEKTLMTNPKWYYKYKLKIRNFLKIFK